MSWENAFLWIEHHPGLASWAQAVGAIASIWGAFAISRSQQKSQQRIADKSSNEKIDALVAVVESSVLFVVVLRLVIKDKPHSIVFREIWRTINGPWMQSTVSSLERVPAHELGRGDLVRGYFGILGGVKKISALIDSAVSAVAFEEQDFFIMYDEVLNQVVIVEETWRRFQLADAARKGQ